jgi:hypothetical protein
MNGTKQIAQRIVNAENSFIEIVKNKIQCSNVIAYNILQYYKKEKILKIDPVMGTFQVKHGIFLEPNILKNAQKLVKSS